MNAEELKKRTKKFAVSIIKLVNSLPKNDASKTIGRQLLRSGTSIGANYRAVCRARSSLEFIAKLGIVIEEADESVFWLELIIESGLMEKKLINNLLQEANEITAIMVSSRKTSIENKNREKSSIINRKSSIENGYILLISILIISAIGLTISISLVLLGIGFSKSSFSLDRSAKAKYYADACVESALQAIWDTDFVGSGSLNFSPGEDCSYEVINDGGNNRTIQASGVSGSVTRKTKVTIDQLSPTIRVTAWQDVADF